MTLSEAMDALKAHESGATDSGINDASLRDYVVTYLRSLSEDDLRRELAICVRDVLSDEAIARGYGVEDAVALIEWFDGFDLPQRYRPFIDRG